MKKVIALAIASAMVAPAAFAAEDDLGMRYTSASEGLYASIRTEFTSGNEKKVNSSIDDSTSRWGIQGDNDLGNGLTGFYRYEANIGQNNGDTDGTRLRYVGLSGAFGSFRAGTVWDDSYNFVYSKTDLSPNDSGRYAHYFRTNHALQYNTPDLNGFVGGIQIRLYNEADNSVGAASAVATNRTPTNSAVAVRGVHSPITSDISATDNQIDNIELNASYSIAGFNIAGSYERIVDGLAPGSYYGVQGASVSAAKTAGVVSLSREDQDRWGVGASYGQDNWNVAGWYGEEEQRNIVQANNGTTVATTGARGTGANWNADKELISIGGNVTVDKVVVFAVWEQSDKNFSAGNDATAGVTGAPGTSAVTAIGRVDPHYYEQSGANVGVIYNLGSKSRVWVEYVSSDNDNNPDADDYINIGMRHNF